MLKRNLIHQEDMVAYIAFQFNELENTLVGYGYTDVAKTLNSLRHVFITHNTVNQTISKKNTQKQGV